MKTYILILAAGVAEDFGPTQPYPHYLTETGGVTLLERIVANTTGVDGGEHIFAFREDDIKRYRLGNIVKNITITPRLFSIPSNTKGSACTAMFVASQIDQSAQLLIISANELVELDFKHVLEEFSRRELMAGTIAFSSTHPRYSYVKVDKNGRVVEAAQQNPISNLATTGVFYFRSTEIFVKSAKSMILKNAHTEGNFYIAPVFNEIILDQGAVGVSLIDKSRYKPLKTEKQIQLYEQGTNA
jgi:dTDP-glucose pyrophosphorylase